MILASILLASSGCNTTKYLKKEEIILLQKNEVKIISEQKIKNKSDLLFNLSTYYKQKPNGKFLGLYRTRLWFYHKNQSPSDTTKWDNWVKRIIAEPPVILKEKLTEGTANAMKSYMQHKGYFNASVEHSIRIDSSKNLAYNLYEVYPGNQYFFDSIFFKAEDDFVQKVLNDTEAESFITAGSPVDVSLYDKEVNRLVKLMRNLGYLDFAKNYISPLAGDTSNFKVNATLSVLSPQDSLGHQVYRIGKVYVYPNYDPDFRGLYTEDERLEGVTYMTIGNPSIKYKTLARNIKLSEGDRYQLINEETTKKRLSSLGIYKFVSIKAIKRDSVRGIVDFRIYLPSKKRQELGADIELNTANNTALNSAVASNTSIGTALSLNYKNKNLFEGAEILTSDLQGGLEFLINDKDRLFNSVDVSASSTLSIPKFVDYVGFYTLLNKMRILPTKNYRKLKETANTRIKIGYNFLDLRDFYKYHSMETSFGYDIKPKDNWRIQYTQTGLTYFNPKTEPAFDTILMDNAFLSKSFGKQLFTGLFAQAVEATYIGKPKKKDINWNLRISGEISGLEVYAANKIFNPSKEWKLFDRIDYATFIKFDVEQTYLKTLSPSKSFAFRANAGLALPFGRFQNSDNNAVPYVKQFYVGGPNSIRAWSIRELGPGGYVDVESYESGNVSPFYQTGDIKMEMNLEYRFDMFWVIEGAMFLDVGNVWTLKEDVDRPNSQISRDFWKQFAIGTGFGFRMDFSYFIMRFDLGYPLRNNYKNINGKYWKTYDSISALTIRDVNFNLAIGYPF